MSDVQIIRDYVPGSIGRVAELHGTYYHEHWGFGLFFEARVATELAAFLGRYDEQKDGFWIALAAVRIPMISAGGSDGRRPAVPRQSGRF